MPSAARRDGVPPGALVAVRAYPPTISRPIVAPLTPRLLRRSATANLEGSLGVGGQNDVGWLLEGEGDERWDQLLAEFPQSGQAMYQSAVFFFGRADYIPGQAMPRDAAERFARGWELYKAALRAEPLNFHYHAMLGREVGLLRPRAAAAGVALPADLPQAGAVLEAAAALAVEVEGRGEQQAAEVVETLCNLVIAAFELEDYDVALAIVGALPPPPAPPRPRNGPQRDRTVGMAGAELGLVLDPSHFTILNRAVLASLFSGKKQRALGFLKRQIKIARDDQER